MRGIAAQRQYVLESRRRDAIEYLDELFAGGADAASQASLQVMSRFLNRLPTITIREGHRVKVYLTNDLELPPYGASDRSSRPLLAGIR